MVADAVMTTQAPTSTSTTSRVPLRLQLRESSSADHVDGGWWPQSRDLQDEAADLIDNFPPAIGHINRLLFSRPDWDNPVVGGTGVRRIHARRGIVKVGSFPSDDTKLMILSLSTGQRVRLRVIPSDTAPSEAERQLRGIVAGTDGVGETDRSRWDDDPTF